MIKKTDSPKLVLPLYQLDSNLVLLPGIIYNVTFSRFKAAALLSRFKAKVENVSLIKNLISEYDFDKVDVLSDDAVAGLQQFFQQEDANVDSQMSDFDWLVLGIAPNAAKIKAPDSRPENPNIVTVVRIIGVTDDTTNVRITFQALVRGVKVPTKKAFKKNEALIAVESPWKVSREEVNHKEFTKNIAELFKAIDKFIVDYRQALALNKAKQGEKDVGDLLTLNPLANSLYFALAGSKDFSRAYISLQKLYGSFVSDIKNSRYDGEGLVRLIDLTSAIVPFPNHQKLNLLNKLTLSKRISELNKMTSGMIEVFDNLSTNTAFVNHWFFNEATDIQKANVVANQLKSIRMVLDNMSNSKNKIASTNNVNKSSKQLVRKKAKAADDDHGEEFDDDNEDDDDEMRGITNFIKNRLPTITTLSSDSKRLLVKDYKRIKNAQPGNSDFHVIKNYLDIVSDLPWDKYVSKFKENKDINIEEARKQLDLDHYGLDHVKKRLLQYLVVLKLLGLNVEQEYEKKKQKENKGNNDQNGITIKSESNAIMIEDSGETSIARKAANSQNRQSKTLTNESIVNKAADEKNVLVSKHNKSPIIMLAGPPGIGKTSLARSIATSLGRNFQRISLGGVKDESEIRGHRRTYVGAMPGVIVQALRKSRSMNPVILLDEIDKIIGGNNTVNKFNGDPSAALLEVLDPEQNTSFTDHYLGFPVDLSQVIFICTANEPHNLSRPLLDRLEMIELGSYDYHEKLIIGRKYLLPRQVKRNGLPSADLIDIEDAVLEKVINNYTREAGVRNLERKLGTICRFKAVEYSQHLDDLHNYSSKVEEFDLPKYLGVPFPNLSMEIYDTPSQYGIVNGLSYNGDGSGSVLTFESIGFTNEKGGSLNMTGRLGEVLMESAKIGLTFIKAVLHRNLLNFSPQEQELIVEKFKTLEIHLHVPMGSISKDGPSAGITMALSFLSLILEKPIAKDIAMTGEITLRGMVLPIGGLKEKILGAHLSGIKRIIAPRENRSDVIEEYVKAVNNEDVLNELLRDNESKRNYKNHAPEEYFQAKFGIQIHYVSEFWDVIKVVWGDDLSQGPTRLIEYHI